MVHLTVSLGLVLTEKKMTIEETRKNDFQCWVKSIERKTKKIGLSETDRVKFVKSLCKSYNIKEAF